MNSLHTTWPWFERYDGLATTGDSLYVTVTCAAFATLLNAAQGPNVIPRKPASELSPTG